MIGVSLSRGKGTTNEPSAVFATTAPKASRGTWSSASGPGKGTVRRPRSAVLSRQSGVSTSHQAAAHSGGFGESMPSTGADAPTSLPGATRDGDLDQESPLSAFSHVSSGPSQGMVSSLKLRVRETSLHQRGQRHASSFIALPNATSDLPRKAQLPRPRSALAMRGPPIIDATPAEVRRQTARDIELRLREELARLPPNSKIARLTVHRRALSDYADSLDDGCARSLLESVMCEYDSLRFERVDEEMGAMVDRVREAQAARQEATEVLRRQQRANGELTLELENLRRQLANRNEVLAQIAATHNITVAGLDSEGPHGKQRQDNNRGADDRSMTLTDIRKNQRRVADKYGAFVQSSGTAADEMEGYLQGEGSLDDLVPKDLGDIGRSKPSKPGEGAGVGSASPPLTHLQLFHASAAPDDAAIDLEADIPPELREQL